MDLDLFYEIMGNRTMYDNQRVFTPSKIAKQMVEMLPE